METYHVAEDVIETLPDGRTIQIAAAGTDIPLVEARRLGLVKDEQSAGPTETKVDAPAEAKAEGKKAKE